MIDHLNDGQLRAALDGELEPIHLHHLESCSICQQKLDAVGAQTQQAARNLAFLAQTGGEHVPAAGRALARIHEQSTIQKENSMFHKLFTNRVLRFGSAVVVIIALVLSIPATRAMASQLLSLFRVQQIAVIPVDFTGMQQLSGDSALGKQISQLVSKSMTVTKQPGDPVTVSDAAQASQEAGFTVRLPQGVTPSKLIVEKGGAFTFTVDRAKAQALIDEAGRKDLVLPASIDGANVSVTIPAGVSAAYGTCPGEQNLVSKDPNSNTMSLNGSNGRQFPDCVLLAEIPSPTVSAPPDVNVEQLAEIGLQFSGMSQAQAAEFAKTVDWTSSLVVPIPKNAATYEKVQVDGVTGTLIQRPVDDAPQFALLWVKNGIIYMIGGLGSDSQKAIQMAASLP
ncbi:MAG TPA: hypothetical protein VGJ97_07610 [Anaerolineaceae bacterium]|jgi:hypothetical protein